MCIPHQARMVRENNQKILNQANFGDDDPKFGEICKIS